MMRKLTDPIFIHFSKIYIHFYEDRRDYWRMFPSLILATLFSINLQILSIYLHNVHVINWKTGVWLPISLVIMFFLLYRKIKYECVKDYKMTVKTRIIISVLIILDLVIVFTYLNISRNGKFMW
jgi:hypothetical protein